MLLATWSVALGPFRSLFQKPKPQEIISWHGEDPVIVDLGRCEPKSTFDESREVSFEMLSTDALLAVRGEVESCLPVVVEITYLNEKRQEIIGQSAVHIAYEGPCDPMPFEVKLNVPKTAKTYQVKVYQPPDRFLARGSLVVRK
ncbi:MAG TPA: hypothetical protein VM165_13670 [Planctomycetaceae bacterium]|nr:hypothetical protein [Planctomycetaceae bacterium]